MFQRWKKKAKNEVFRNIASGKVLSLDNMPDKVFSQRMMGDGYALEPLNETIYAPSSGTLTAVFPTGHAYGIVTAEGLEILIHLGVDTVQLQGKGFVSYVKQGDVVKQGDRLATMDLNYIKEQGKSTLSAILFTSGEKIVLLKENEFVDQNTEQIFAFIAE